MSAPPPPRRTVGLRWLLVVAGVIALVAVGWFVIRGLGGGTGGADSPEDAVGALADAIDAEDPAAAIDALEPDEVRTLGDLYTDAEARARRLGFTGESGTFAGIDLTASDLTYRTEELGPGVARVVITGGRLGYRVDPARLSSRARAVVQADAGPLGQNERGGDPRGLGVEGAPDPFLVAVDRGDGWYVSPYYTVAEYAVRTGDGPTASFGEDDDDDDAPGPQADSPAAAVESLIRTGAGLDVEATTAQLSRQEARVLRDYRAAVEEFLGIDEVDDELVIDEVAVTASEPDEGSSVVRVDRLTGSVRSGGDAEPFLFDGQCLITGAQGDRERDCLTPDAARVGVDEVVVVAVEDGGSWAASPAATAIEYGRRILERLDTNLVLRLLGTEYTADPVATIEVGDELTTRLNDAGFAVYEVELAEGQPVTLAVDERQLRAGDDASAELYGPGGEGLDADGDALVPVRDGVHRLVVRRERLAAGRVPIALRGVEATPINVGDPPVEVSVGPNESRDVTFDLQAGDVVLVAVTPAAADYNVLGPDGSVLITDDPPVYEITESGRHRVRVRGGGGPVTVEVASAPPFSLNGGTAPVPGIVAAPGQVTSYELFVRADTGVQVMVAPAPDLDVIVEVFTDGDLVDRVDLGQLGAAEGFTVSPGDTSAVYEIRVNGYQPGGYTVSVAG